MLGLSGALLGCGFLADFGALREDVLIGQCGAHTGYGLLSQYGALLRSGFLMGFGTL